MLKLNQLNLFDIPIHLKWDLLPGAGFLVWILAAAYFPVEYPYWTETEYILVAFFAALLAYASFLAHELGHAIAGLNLGIGVERISLFILGGSTQLVREAGTPSREVGLVLAGPLVSGCAAVLMQIITSLSHYGEPMYAVSHYLAQANFLLVLFNLLPVLPMDGGRLIRAVIWKLGIAVENCNLVTNLISLSLAGLIAIILLYAIPLLNIFSIIMMASTATILGMSSCANLVNVRN